MKKLRFSRWYLLLALPVLLGVAGLIWGRPDRGQKAFECSDLKGRYVSAAYEYDGSSIRQESDGSVTPPQVDGETSYMLTDGKGHVCGETDGYGLGIDAPGFNIPAQPMYFLGTYTVDPTTGKLTMYLCVATSTTCTGSYIPTSPVCNGSTTQGYATGDLIRELTGFLESTNGYKVTTLDQVFGDGFSGTTSGFLLRARVWTKDASEEQDHY
jgi:hypothetical protein